MIKVVVADDESLARERLCAMLKRFDQVQVVGEASDGDEVLDLCRQMTPDAVFLDINMPGLSGLEAAAFLQNFPAQIAVVFVTAYQEHALEAFDLNATDYLTKPIRPSRLADTVARLGQESKVAVHPAASADTQKLALPTAGKTIFLEPANILFAVSKEDTVDLVCPDRTHHLNINLKQLEQRLQSDQRFYKVSRQCLVNLDQVSTHEPAPSGTSLLTMQSGHKIEVSRNATKALKQKWG